MGACRGYLECRRGPLSQQPLIAKAAASKRRLFLCAGVGSARACRARGHLPTPYPQDNALPREQARLTPLGQIVDNSPGGFTTDYGERLRYGGAAYRLRLPGLRPLEKPPSFLLEN